MTVRLQSSAQTDIIDRIGSRIAGVPHTGAEHTFSSKQEKLIRHWALHPWNWMSGRDLDDRPIIWTKDERDKTGMTVKPFPTQFKYLQVIVDVIHNEDFILLDKARQMYCSTVILLYLDWYCRFKIAARCMWSKSTEDEAKEHLEDKVRFPHSQLPDWVQLALPQDPKPAIKIRYPQNKYGGGSSYILAVAENVAEREARGGTSTIVGIDEAARQAKFRKLVQAAKPMAGKIIALTTAELGNDGAEYFREMIEDVTVQDIVQLNPLPVPIS